jgi:hypothetical protein
MKFRKLSQGERRPAKLAAERKAAPKGPQRTSMNAAERHLRKRTAQLAVVSSAKARSGRLTTVPTAKDVTKAVNKQLGASVSERTTRRDLGPRERVVRAARRAADARRRRLEVRQLRDGAPGIL